MSGQGLRVLGLVGAMPVIPIAKHDLEYPIPREQWQSDILWSRLSRCSYMGRGERGEGLF